MLHDDNIQSIVDNFSSALSQGPLKYIGVHICEQRNEKGSFFAVERIKQGTLSLIRVSNSIFQEKGVVMSKFTQIL